MQKQLSQVWDRRIGRVDEVAQGLDEFMVVQAAL